MRSRRNGRGNNFFRLLYLYCGSYICKAIIILKCLTLERVLLVLVDKVGHQGIDLLVLLLERVFQGCTELGQLVFRLLGNLRHLLLGKDDTFLQRFLNYGATFNEVFRMLQVSERGPCIGCFNHTLEAV